MVDPPAPGPTTRAVLLHLADMEALAEDIVDRVATVDRRRSPKTCPPCAPTGAAYARPHPPPGYRRRPDASPPCPTTSAQRRRPGTPPGRHRAADDASGATRQLLARYALGPPVETGRLDVLGRQVVIDAGRGDFSAATAQIRQAEQQLAAVQPSLAARGGDQVLAQTRATLAEMQRMADAKNGDGLTTQAKVLLEVVGGMERRYG